MDAPADVSRNEDHDLRSAYTGVIGLHFPALKILLFSHGLKDTLSGGFQYLNKFRNEHSHTHTPSFKSIADHEIHILTCHFQRCRVLPFDRYESSFLARRARPICDEDAFTLAPSTLLSHLKAGRNVNERLIQNWLRALICTSKPE